MKILKKISPKNELKWRYSYWLSEHHRSYIESVNLWIYAYDNNLELPEDVLKVFANGIKKHYLNHKIQNPKNINHQKNLIFKESYLIFRFVKLFVAIKNNKRGSQAAAFKRIEELFDKKDRNKTANSETIKKRYLRMANHMKAVEESWKE